MRKMKYGIFAMAVCFGMTSMQAQEKAALKSNPDVAYDENRIEKMREKFELSEDQVERIKDIMSARADEKAKLKDMFKQLKEEERREMESIFTDEQRARLDEMKERRQELIERRRAEREERGEGKKFQRNKK